IFCRSQLHGDVFYLSWCNCTGTRPNSYDSCCSYNSGSDCCSVRMGSCYATNSDWFCIAVDPNFGKPINDYNIESWFSAYNFLSYSSSLYVCRAVDANAVNSLANTGTATPIQVNNSDAYEALTSLPTNSLYMAKYPGSLGNSLQVSVCDSANAY